MRVLTLARNDERLEGAEVVYLISGIAPTRATVAQTVNACERNMTGASHCQNELSLPSGRIVVRHDHGRMVACLMPGEAVCIVPTPSRECSAA